ncbi:hypothetical protein SDC9_154864 [bioreactor metagenome]|uniref:Uncharacterized protein n=1 Tax=bioreactor metagenome TaxID=1076179 RepID=A0A645F4V8_9ZZZZ
MDPLGHLIGAVADISGGVLGPFVVARHDVLAERIGGGEGADFLEIGAVIGQGDHKGLANSTGNAPTLNPLLFNISITSVK